jgi:hypothetical protein
MRRSSGRLINNRGHHRVVPAANRFFHAPGDYLHDERPD